MTDWKKRSLRYMIEEDLLRKLYIEDNLSGTKISKALGISQHWVYLFINFFRLYEEKYKCQDPYPEYLPGYGSGREAFKARYLYTLKNGISEDKYIDIKEDNRDYLSTAEEWRIAVLKKHNFTCVVCGKPCNSAHHIYSRFYCQKNNPDLEWDIRNGVASCYECHDSISKDGRKWFNK